MAKGTLSLLGIYRYTGDVLDDLALPDAIEEDRQTIIDNLLMETAELEILYPDSWFLKQAIGAWSRKQVRVWDELYKTTQYEYNPIWNKDGSYTEQETTTNKMQSKENGITGSTASGNNKDVAEHDVYGFNSEDAAHESRDTSTGEFTNTGRTDMQMQRNADSTEGRQLTRIEQGNIGVTSTQSLIKEQRDVVLFNIMDVIIEDFKNRFCLQVY